MTPMSPAESQGWLYARPPNPLFATKRGRRAFLRHRATLGPYPTQQHMDMTHTRPLSPQYPQQNLL